MVELDVRAVVGLVVVGMDNPTDWATVVFGDSVVALTNTTKPTFI